MAFSPTSIINGMADVRIAPAAAHLTVHDPILCHANSVGFMGPVSVIKSSTPIVRSVCKAGSIFAEIVGYKNTTVSVTAEVKSFTPSNLRIMLGSSSGITTDQSIIDSEFSLMLSTAGEFRVEIVSIYSFAGKALIFVIPRANISPDLELNFSTGSALAQKINLSSAPLHNPTWKDDPLGRLIIT